MKLINVCKFVADSIFLPVFSLADVVVYLLIIGVTSSFVGFALWAVLWMVVSGVIEGALNLLTEVMEAKNVKR